MDNETYAKKREQLAAVEAIVATDGYKILSKEIERIRDTATEVCCDVTKPRETRDAAGGSRKTCIDLLAFLPALRRSLEATTDSERKTRLSRKSRT
jgi:hypothetical protein